ncbi:MAG: oligosaccharide flippase family protein [Hyphomicrobium sp.]
MGSRIFQAAGLTALAVALGMVLRLVSNLIMTRILAPEAFGIVSVVLVVQTILVYMSDLGLRQTIIQSRRGDDPAFLNTAWTMQIMRGFAMFIVGLVVAGLLALAAGAGHLRSDTTWGHPQLPALMAVASAWTVIAGFQSTNLATATRKIALHRILAIELVAQFCGIVLMVALALVTRSLWSIVAGGIATTLISTLASHLYLPGIANRFTMEPEAKRDILKFGSWVLLSSVATVCALSLDRILLAGLVSPGVLGLYAIALNLILMAENVGARLSENIVLPSLSEFARQDPASFRTQLYRLRFPFDLAFLSLAGLIFATGPNIIALLYDERYSGAGDVLTVLSCILIFTRYSIFSSAYLALGHPKWLAIINCAKLAASVFLFIALYKLYGFIGGVYAIALHPLFVLPLHFWFNDKHKLNNFSYEALILLAWPIGYVAGQLALVIFNSVSK